ncbi:MAG: sigma-70 family RNA polymerase sigma factor [Alphaproteobacteria bacterium]|nr:sigma-70 family RNA polymerase sigma factor [Alphaproteobacteria bacterium]
MNDGRLADAAAFTALVREHQSALRGFLRRLTKGDHALADDLAQETFLAAYRKLSQFRGESSFASWLYAIAWSRFLMAARRRKEEPLEEADGEAFHPEAASITKLDLEKALCLLRAPERAALTLCFALGMGHQEAAAVLTMPLGTLKSHVARGREKLKTLLQDHTP